MTTREDLEACPFCGLPEEVFYDEEAFQHGSKAPWTIKHRCNDTWRGLVEFHGETKEEAIKAWNTRATPPLPEEVREAVDRLKGGMRPFGEHDYFFLTASGKQIADDIKTVIQAAEQGLKEKE